MSPMVKNLIIMLVLMTVFLGGSIYDSKEVVSNPENIAKTK